MSVQAQPSDYAKAIYELAFETWSRQLGAVQQALRADPALWEALDDPTLSVQEKLDRLQKAVSGGLEPLVRRFLGTLLEAGEIEQLDRILVEFERLVQRHPRRRLARVTSAVPLTEAEEEALRRKLIARYGPELDFQFEVDKSLIGGIRLQVGDQVIDGSVAGKLAALREELSAA